MRFWIWIVIILIVAGGGSWWFGLFDKMNTFSFTYFPSDAINIDVNKITDQVTEKFNEPSIIKNETSSLIDNLYDFPKKIGAETVGQFKNSFVGSAKNEVGQIIDSVQQNLGLKAITPVNEKPFTVSLSSESNKPISFLIDGSNGEGVYVIDWGDGERVSGKIEMNDKKIVHHSWPEAGIYLVNALISNNNQTHQFSFPINIR